MHFTESSQRQREGLSNGTVDIVHSAVDNAVAMIDVAKVDVVIVSGGDSGTNEFDVQDSIRDFADIRGHAIVVDATNTAYALQVKKILLQHGLKDGVDYTLNPVGNGSRRLKALLENKSNAGAILNLPYSLEAAANGLHSLGRTDRYLGPYQAGGAFVRRDWARDACDKRWNNIWRRSSKPCAGRWMQKTAPLPSAFWSTSSSCRRNIAAKSLDLMAEPGFGFARDAAFDLAGFKNVLALRAEVEGGKLADPQRYIDLSYYDRAMKLVKE